MTSPPDFDSVHDEYGPAEVLEAVVVKPQRASVVFIKNAVHADEATSCLAFLGMRWLDRSEIIQESRRRSLSYRGPGVSQYFGPTHKAASLGTFVPSQHTSKSMHQTGNSLLPPYSSASSEDDFADTHDPELEISQPLTQQTVVNFNITSET